MKKIILILIFIPLVLLAQPYQSTINSRTTNLDSAGVFTGTIEKITSDYNWIAITVRSDQSGTGVLQWTRSNMGTVVWDNANAFTHTASDTTTNTHWFPVKLGYFRVIYTNDTAATTQFRLTTVLMKGSNSEVDLVTGDPKVTISNATSIGMTASIYVHDVEVTDSNPFPVKDDSLRTLNTNIEADADSIVDKVTEIDNNTDLVETKLDTLLARVERDLITNSPKVTISNPLSAVTNGSGIHYKKEFTVTTAGDSLIVGDYGGLSVWWGYTIETDDTIYYSNTSSSYPLYDKMTLKPTENYTSKDPLLFTYVNKLFFKVKGAGTANVRIWFWGF